MDHIAGFDELRAFCWETQKSIPIYAHPYCLKQLKKCFPWTFQNKKGFLRYTRIQAHKIRTKPFKIGDIKITPLPVFHDNLPTLGFLIHLNNGKSFAYIPDVCKFPNETLEKIKGIDILILNALREAPAQKHLCFTEALKISSQIKAKQTYFTHFSHDVDYQVFLSHLPKDIFLSYDGLQISL